MKIMNEDIDLIYSPDDGGWYFHRYSDDHISKTYKSEEKAMRDWRYVEAGWPKRIKWTPLVRRRAAK
jgi:hypothetical protein